MAQDEASKLAEQIVNNLIPLNQVQPAQEKGASVINSLLQSLGLGQAPAQAAPPLNAPLPRFGGVGPNGQPIIIPPQQRR